MSANDKRRAAPRNKRGGTRASSEPLNERYADELERGDVIYWQRVRQVVLQPSEPLPEPADEDAPRTTRGGTAIDRACHLRIAELTTSGNVSARSSQTITVPRSRAFIIAAHIDV